MTRTLTSSCLAIFVAMVLMGPWCDADCLASTVPPATGFHTVMTPSVAPASPAVVHASAMSHCQPHRVVPSRGNRLPSNPQPCERTSHSKITKLSPTTLTVPFVASMDLPERPVEEFVAPASWSTLPAAALPLDLLRENLDLPLRI